MALCAATLMKGERRGEEEGGDGVPDPQQEGEQPAEPHLELEVANLGELVMHSIVY